VLASLSVLLIEYCTGSGQVCGRSGRVQEELSSQAVSAMHVEIVPYRSMQNQRCSLYEILQSHHLYTI
jgi:hypothetical protein